MWGKIKSLISSYLETRTRPALHHIFETKQPLVWLLALATGILGAFAIMAFLWVIETVQFLWIGNGAENTTATVLAGKPAWIIVAGPLAVGLIVGLLLTFVTPGRRAQGMADVIAARAVHGADIPWRTGLMSAIISAVSLGGGASAGREGPAVHFGATIASGLGRAFSLPYPARRVLLACGAAAAVSASFNAPIAGVLFAHEVILAHYAASAVMPIVISSVAATATLRIVMGNAPIFVIPAYAVNSPFEFPAFVILGIVCGLMAVVFQLAIATADKTASRVHVPLWVRPVVGGLLLGLIGLAMPEVLGVGYEATSLSLRSKYGLSFLIVLIAVKLIAIAITLASRFGGGVFSPSLFLGAATGSAFGLIAGSIFPELASDTSLYAIVGMGAVAGAVLGAPLSTVLIVFELTGGYEMTIALLLAVPVANMTAKALCGQSFFHWQLSIRGLVLDCGPHQRIMRTWSVADFVTPLDPNNPNPDTTEFANRPTLYLNDNLETALKAFADGTYTRLIVIAPGESEPRQVGWADYTKALAEYNRALVQANEEEHR